MTKKWLNSIISFITIVIVGVIVVFFSSLIIPQDQNLINEAVEEIEKNQNKPSDFPDYDLLANFHSFLVTQNVISFAKDPNNIIGRTKKIINPQGEFERAYLLIEASVDDGKPLSAYDDIYLTLNLKGGHLLTTSSLNTPPNDISSLLFSAQEMLYKTSKDPGEIKMLDVLNVLNENKKVEIDTFLSTAREGGEIRNFVIFYECAEDSSCSIQE